MAFQITDAQSRESVSVDGADGFMVSEVTALH